MVFHKERADAPVDFFAAEAAGLRWLGAAGAPVVEVIDVGEHHIDLEQLDTTRPSTAAARPFGAALARMHDAGAAHFGSPPDGFSGQVYIGSQPMSSRTHERWGEFYAAERVMPFADKARRRGNLGAQDHDIVRRVCEIIADGRFDDPDPPARIHGDLWNGNVVWTPGGAVMIDPAAHGGHRETDLAMLELFGCPLLDEIEQGYTATHALRRGWRERVPVHQLHPLAVHAASHGPMYGFQLRQAAEASLRLAGRDH